MVRVGMVGFGNIAQAHRQAYWDLEAKGVPVKLVAVCDIDPSKYTTLLSKRVAEGQSPGLEGIRCYDHMDKMADAEQLDLVDICVPTPVHAPAAIHMLERGYHVLSEKPMARRYSDCLQMLEAAGAAGRRLMIGQCVRFFPEYQYLQEVVKDGRYGQVLSAFFDRLAGGMSADRPLTWFGDYAQSGGALLDLHIHDIDMTRWLFGEPVSVCCTGRGLRTKFDAVNSQLHYGDEKLVNLTADWSLSGPYPFTARYRVNLEGATLIGENGAVTVYLRDGESFQPALTGGTGIANELEYLVGLIESGGENYKNPPESAAQTVKLAEALCQSAEKGGEQVFL